MNPIFSAALEVQRVCSEHGWPYFLIGALAVLRWGEPRLTRDVDVTIVTGYGGEEPVVDVLLDRLTPRIEEAREFALRNRVLLLRSSNGTPVDVALGALPFEERAAQRASLFSIGEHALLTCSAEDLVVMKAFAGRAQDWMDIEGVATRQGADLDRELIWAELTPLLELRVGTDTEERLRSILDG